MPDGLYAVHCTLLRTVYIHKNEEVGLTAKRLSGFGQEIDSLAAASARVSIVRDQTEERTYETRTEDGCAVSLATASCPVRLRRVLWSHLGPMPAVLRTEPALAGRIPRKTIWVVRLSSLTVWMICLTSVSISDFDI